MSTSAGEWPTRSKDASVPALALFHVSRPGLVPSSRSRVCWRRRPTVPPSAHPGPKTGSTGGRQALRVTPVPTVTLDQARAWIRGTKPLPGTDRRVFLTEVLDAAEIGGTEVADSLARPHRPPPHPTLQPGGRGSRCGPGERSVSY